VTKEGCGVAIQGYCVTKEGCGVAIRGAAGAAWLNRGAA
jgi:hypothetical protein